MPASAHSARSQWPTSPPAAAGAGDTDSCRTARYRPPIALRDVIAVDWSGAAGSGRAISFARARDGELQELLAGISREQAMGHVIDVARRDSDVVVGLDFAFSLPAWFLRERGLRSVHEVWELVAAEGESWLTGCEPPFWGRPGKQKPDLYRHFRSTEQRLAPVGGLRPKSVFQIGGAGSVGTGSIRGMPWLSELRRAGLSIWPFDEPALPLVVEIWPRLLTGPVVKSSAERRRDYLAALARTHGIPEALAAQAARSEDSFDAAVSALVMSQRWEEFAHLKRATDPQVLLEGEIWVPRRLPVEPRPGLRRAS